MPTHSSLSRHLCCILAMAAGLLAAAAVPVCAAEQDFAAWLEEFRREAAMAGISETTLDAAFADVTAPIPRVIELDRNQPEGRMSFAQYRARIVSEQRIADGIEAYRRHRGALMAAQRETGVPARVIAALWGVETSYGRITGGYHVPAALATLAHDGRRSAFFRAELLDALRIIEAGHIAADEMTGSWAGAMGQSQFMPSSFIAYARDGDGDGRRDIWHSHADVFASAGNYLRRNGWNPGELWGRPIILPRGFDTGLAGLENARNLAVWNRLGLRRANGLPLPEVAGMQGALIMPDGANGPAFLVYDNYRAFLRWNNSSYFALSVGLLADAIARGVDG